MARSQGLATTYDAFHAKWNGTERHIQQMRKSREKKKALLSSNPQQVSIVESMLRDPDVFRSLLTPARHLFDSSKTVLIWVRNI